MKSFISFVFFLILCGCKNSQDFTVAFEKHNFDPTVINNLPIYDSLGQIILRYYDSFHLSETKRDFTYFYDFDSSSQISGGSNRDVPAIMYPQTVELFDNIGKENIFGFTISKDSTIAILIRNTHLTDYYLDVRERLYWYPIPSRIIKWEFPSKDTILTNKWQYQIWYDKRARLF